MRLPLSLALTLILCLVVGGGRSAFAADLERQFQNLPPAQVVLTSAERYQVKGSVVAVVPVKGMPFDTAISCTSQKMYDKSWGAQVYWTGEVEGKKGDMLLLAFWSRAIPPYLNEQSAQSPLNIVMQYAESPYRPILNKKLSVSKEWERYFIPFKLADDIAPKSYTFAFRYGYGAMGLEIAQMMILKYPATTPMRDLPNSLAGDPPEPTGK